MKPARFHRSLIVLAAIAAVAAEIALGWQARLPQTILLPLAIATGGAMIWALLALSAVLRRDEASIREEVEALRSRAEGMQAGTAALDHRLTAMEQHLHLIAAEPEIAAAQRLLGHAADRVEAWDDLEASLPHWNAAVERWSAAVSGVHPDCAPRTEVAGSDELREARAQLPPTVNLSSRDLRAAAEYIVQRERVVAAYQRLAAYRARVDDAWRDSSSPRQLAGDRLE